MDKADFHNMLKYLSVYMEHKDESPICAKDLLQLNAYLLDLEKKSDELQRKLDIAADALEKCIFLAQIESVEDGKDMDEIQEALKRLRATNENLPDAN